MKSFWDNLPQPFFILAPMEAVTDVVFRHVVKRAGSPDVFFTEFANATGWVHAGDKAIAGRLVKTDDEHPLVAQIWGGEPGYMEQFAAHCAKLGFDGIDINMGCPAKSAIKSGGAALIRQPDVAVAAITAAKTAKITVLCDIRPEMVEKVQQVIEKAGMTSFLSRTTTWCIPAAWRRPCGAPGRRPDISFRWKWRWIRWVSWRRRWRRGPTWCWYTPVKYVDTVIVKKYRLPGMYGASG